jgi:hypothetical protein
MVPRLGTSSITDRLEEVNYLIRKKNRVFFLLEISEDLFYGTRIWEIVTGNLKVRLAVVFV